MHRTPLPLSALLAVMACGCLPPESESPRPRPASDPRAPIDLGLFEVPDIAPSDALAALVRGPLVAIVVEPDDLPVLVGTRAQIVARGRYASGVRGAITERVTWTSSDTAVATIDATGLLTAHSVGFALITAVDPMTGVSSADTQTSSLVEVIPLEIAAIEIVPGRVQLRAGGTASFTAQARFTDGFVRDVTSLVVWSVSDPAVATITGPGQVSTIQPGSATVSAHEPVTGTSSAPASIEVTAPPTVPPQVVSVAGSPPWIVADYRERPIPAQIAIDYDDGTSVVGRMTDWVSTDPSIAHTNGDGQGVHLMGQIGATWLHGLVTKNGTDYWTQDSGGSIYFEAKEALSLTLMPRDPVLRVGETVDLAAIATFHDGTEHDVDYFSRVSSLSFDPGIAAEVYDPVAKTYLLTGISPGTTTFYSCLCIPSMASPDFVFDDMITVTVVP